MLTDQMRVGAQEVTLKVVESDGSSPKIVDVLKGFQTQLGILAEPRVVTVAAQVLLIVCRKTLIRTSTCDYFSKSEQPLLQKIMPFTGRSTHTNVHHLALDLDKVVEYRNNSVCHFTEPSALDHEVLMLSVFAEAPELRHRRPIECNLILNYEKIKLEFADEFRVAFAG